MELIDLYTKAADTTDNQDTVEEALQQGVAALSEGKLAELFPDFQTCRPLCIIGITSLSIHRDVCSKLSCVNARICIYVQDVRLGTWRNSKNKGII